MNVHAKIDPQHPAPVVIATDRGVRTNSRDVAAFFEKRHDHVLRDIDRIVEESRGGLPNFGEGSVGGPFLNFEEGSYTLSSTGTQKHRCFDMDRDGFMLLAMGFTGGKALKLKLAFIAAFNEMEARLAALSPDPADPAFDRHPSSADFVIEGIAASKYNALMRGAAVVGKYFGPEAARLMVRRNLPGGSDFEALTVGEIAGCSGDDGIGCLSHLLRAAVGGMPLARVLDLAASDMVARRRLTTHGVTVAPEDMRGVIAVAAAHPFLTDLYAETQWQGSWSKALLTLPGSRPSSVRRNFGKVVAPSVLLPSSAIMNARGH